MPDKRCWNNKVKENITARARNDSVGKNEKTYLVKEKFYRKKPEGIAETQRDEYRKVKKEEVTEC